MAESEVADGSNAAWEIDLLEIGARERTVGDLSHAGRHSVFFHRVVVESAA